MTTAQLIVEAPAFYQFLCDTVGEENIEALRIAVAACLSNP